MSPFLYNVYMHEFDERVIRLQRLSKNVFNFFKCGFCRNLELKRSYCDETRNIKRFVENEKLSTVFLEVSQTVFSKSCRVDR